MTTRLLTSRGLQPMRLTGGSGVAVAGSLLVALTLLLWSIGTIPGLQVDEAWVGQETWAIAFGGSRPVDGMNDYTGATHLYLLAAAVKLFGFHLLVFRGFSALFNGLFVLAAMSVVRALTRKASEAAWAGALLASSPLFLLESRFTTELTALVPALLMGGLALCLRGASCPRRRGLLYPASGGVLLGLACFTHAASLIFVVSVAAGALAAHGLRLLRHRPAAIAALGFVVGFGPRWVGWCRSASSWTASARSNIGSDLLQDLPNLLPLLRGVLDGDLLYLRFTGELLVPVLPYASGALLAVFALRIRAMRKVPLAPAERGALCAAVTSLAATALLTPALSLRYFMFSAWLLQLASVVTVGRLRDAVPRAGRAAAGLLAAMVAFNLFYVPVDFLLAFSRTGGTLSVFSLGGRLEETSDHFVRTDRLYRELAGRGVERVLGRNFIVWPLAFYERVARRGMAFEELVLETVPPEAGPLDPDLRAALVFYSGPGESRASPGFDHLHERVVSAAGLPFRLDESFDPHFRVFLSPAAASASRAPPARCEAADGGHGPGDPARGGGGSAPAGEIGGGATRPRSAPPPTPHGAAPATVVPRARRRPCRSWPAARRPACSSQLDGRRAAPTASATLSGASARGAPSSDAPATDAT